MSMLEKRNNFSLARVMFKVMVFNEQLYGALQVRVYDLASMSCSYVLSGHTEIVLCLDTCVSSSGRTLIVTGSKDNTVSFSSLVSIKTSNFLLWELVLEVLWFNVNNRCPIKLIICLYVLKSYALESEIT